MHAIIKALAVPPKLSINSIVNLESLYGIYGIYFFLSERDFITFPKVNKLLLIFPVSFTISP